MIKLSICIPTYNRAEYLRVCLEHLENQVKSDFIEIIVIDNASSDYTQLIVEAYKQKITNLKYYRNDNNLGYTGNQIKCYQYSTGLYTAFLSDDDIYLDGLVYDIMQLIEQENYDFIALNYYSFLYDYKIVKNNNFAPTKNIKFERAYDILNYPSVGHWSGFIVKSDIVKNTLNKILKDNSYHNFEKNRGIIGPLMHNTLSKSKGKSFFYGKQLLAVREPEVIDYDILEHLYLDNIKTFKKYYIEGIINKSDYKYRKKLVLESLPKAIIIASFKNTNQQLYQYKKEFDKIFTTEISYFFICKTVFFFSRFYIIRKILFFLYKLKKKYDRF